MRSARYPLAALLLLTASSFIEPAAFDPGKPKNLEAIADGPFAVDLDWRRVSGSEGYYVYRDGDRVAEASRSSYRDEGLEPSTTYEYRVSAFDDDGDEGDLSDPVKVTTDALPGPGTPTDLLATATGPTRIDLEWSPSEGGAEVAFYRVYRDDNEVAAPSETTFADAGLSPETKYEYRVSAVDGDGRESPRSEPASATTLAEPGPPPPEQLAAADIWPTQVKLTWSPPSGSGFVITGYNVYRGGDFVGFVVATTFTDTGLEPETTYRYSVSTVDDRPVEGDRSEELSATTASPPDVIPPAAPTGLRLAGS